MAVKFNIPTQPRPLRLDIDNFQGLDTKMLNPTYNRASVAYNFYKKNGLHQIRPVIIEKYISGVDIISRG